MTYAELYDAVARVATSLREMGVQPGDRVVAYMPNLIETAVAMLATTSIGAVWASCATDLGPAAARDRLGQVAPKVLFTVDGYYYKGQAIDTREKQLPGPGHPLADACDRRPLLVPPLVEPAKVIRSPAIMNLRFRFLLPNLFAAPTNRTGVPSYDCRTIPNLDKHLAALRLLRGFGSNFRHWPRI